MTSKRNEKHSKLALILITTVIIAACAKEKIEMKNSGTSYIETTNSSPYTSRNKSATKGIVTETPPVSASGTLLSESFPAEHKTEPGSTDVSLPPESSAAAEATTVVMSGVNDNDITSTAKTLLGIPFTSGGDNPKDGFDNSGFIYYVLRQNGYASCPRNTREQAEMGTSIASLAELLPGDLAFFSDNGTAPQYGGIYIGDGVMIYSPQPTQNVKEVNVSNGYYARHFLKGVRVS